MPGSAGPSASRAGNSRSAARRGPAEARTHRGDVHRSAPSGRPGQGGVSPAMENQPIRSHERYDRLLRAAKQLPPVTTAVAHPCDEVSLKGAVEAARLGLIAPILVGPPDRVRDIAERAELDISGFPLKESAHSHDSAAKAVEIVREGKAEALMKGSLHTDELMGAVVAREGGIRTARRISHCFVMDVPGHKDPLVVTDAAVNIAPDLDAKVDIVQNAIDLGHALQFDESAWRSCRRWRRSIPRSPRRSRPRHCARWPTAARLPARSSTARWRSTTRSAKRRRRSSTSSPRLPGGQMSWWCRISKRATCWPRA